MFLWLVALNCKSKPFKNFFSHLISLNCFSHNNQMQQKKKKFKYDAIYIRLLFPSAFLTTVAKLIWPSSLVFVSMSFVEAGILVFHFDPKGSLTATIEKDVGWSSDQNHNMFTFQHQSKLLRDMNGRRSTQGVRSRNNNSFTLFKHLHVFFLIV